MLARSLPEPLSGEDAQDHQPGERLVRGRLRSSTGASAGMNDCAPGTGLGRSPCYEPAL